MDPVSNSRLQRSHAAEGLTVSVNPPNKSVVIVGGGNIGRFLALEMALGGANVSVIEPNTSVIETSKSIINIRLKKAAVLPSEMDAVLERITFIPGTVGGDSAVDDILASATMVVEALPEKKEVKRGVLRHLDTVVAPNVPITTVSSSFPISELLDGVQHSERFINSHPLQYGMAPVEVMPSLSTAPAITNQVSGVFTEIGMAPILVRTENVGFIFNIVWRHIKKQVLELVDKGVTTPQDFDRLWMMTFKTAIGPFGLMDTVGLDVVLDIEKRYYSLSGKPEDAPPDFLRLLVAENRLGIKTQLGFYSYPNPAYTHPGFLECGRLQESGEVIVPIKESLVGSWRLVSFIAEREEDSEVFHPMGDRPLGKLTYGSDGSMSVYLGASAPREHFRTQDPLGGSVEEKSRAFSEVFFYMGGWRYRNGLMLHDIEVCSFPNWSGETQIRYATFADGLLTLTTPPLPVAGAVGVQKLIWKREGF
jgi:3-hydroxybutyryl-CoA dehydrogenase